MKKVAILGGGFAGMSLAWYLCHYTLGSTRIDIYDPNPVAMGATRVSLGILNPFMGKQANRAWMATKAVREVHRLITEAASSSHTPIVNAVGLLRPTTDPKQASDFQATAIEYPQEATWWGQAECEERIPGLKLPEEGGGLFVPQAVTIDVEKYLRGLWANIARHGVQYLKFTVLGQEALAKYDHIVVALGANTLDFGILSQLPMTRIKGQVIELKWPEHLPPLNMSLSGEGQVIMSADKKSCFVGSTYEKDFKSFEANPTFAREEIMRKIAPIFPALAEAPLLSCRARVRGASKNRLPLIGKVNEQIWFFAGLGSKGLLYHAFAARQLAQALLSDDPSLIMPELWHPLQLPADQKRAAPPQRS